MDGDLSIEAARPNALTNFLRADHVKKDTKYILAALLLLSEGVDIKIDIDHTEKKKKLVIKSKKSKEKVFVGVEMYTAGIDPVTNMYSDSIYQYEAAEVVKFYIRCRDNPLLKKGGEFAMPSCKKEFESGKFLNSAAFLIQTYIYEFIDTPEDYKDFVEAVHELLVDQVVEKENPEQTKKKGKKGRIFDELFLAKEELSENIKYVELFYDLVKDTEENAIIPFCNDSQLPKFTRVPLCKLDKSGFEKNQAFYYSDCVETALLGLFCCLAYNPETKEYETSHMGAGVSKELRDFFRDYPKPTEATDFEMHKQWSKVVACLDNHEIDYKKEKNELIAGISNIFLVIAEITGQKTDTQKLVEYIESADKAGKLDDMQKFYIKYKIESIIRSLSLNKNVGVDCKQMRLGKRSNGKADILAGFSIMYYFNNTRSGIVLDIKKGHANLSLLSSLDGNSAYIREKCEEVKNIYNRAECYIGYIVCHYIDIEVNILEYGDYAILQNIKNDINLMLQGESENVSKILLYNRISKVFMKGYIMEFFAFGAVTKGVALTNSLTRFTANILGSVPLNDPITRFLMIHLLPILKGWRECYPKLGYTASDCPSEHIFAWGHAESMHFYKKILEYPVPIAVKATCNYLRAVSGHDDQIHHAKHFITWRLLFNHIISDGTIDNLVKIQSVITEYMKKHTLNHIYICWFIHACTDKYKLSPEQIKEVYSFILPDVYPQGFYVRIVIETKKEFHKCLSVLKEKKTLFCSENDPKSMEKYNGLMAYIDHLYSSI